MLFPIKNRAVLPALTMLFCLLAGHAFGQYKQNLKGVVLDKALKTPLVGVTVILGTTDPVKGAVTDLDGRFRISDIPVGKHALKATYIGYKDAFLANITVNSGKETDLTIEMEEQIISGNEVVITAKVEKQKALNELATVSARTFSVEETQRFAAAINDPARMASSFAGVAMPSDGNNTISIRGNAPNGLLWRMEGVDIPNPNHFSQVGTSGGGISILSAQLLTNSDFMTGAFPAEYGNAVSGVFDLKMRKGNSEKHEYTVQAGVLGLDLAAEGPLKMGKRTGSFLVNYRYSTLSLVSKLGVNLGGTVTKFQDLSFNVWMPAGKAGTFTLFGLGGLSSQTYEGKADSTAWTKDAFSRYGGEFRANTGVVGLTHSLILGDKTALKTVVAVSGTQNEDITDSYKDDYTIYRLYDNAHGQGKMTVSSVLNHKFNSRHLLRTGAYYNLMGFNFSQHEWNRENERLEEQIYDQGDASSVQAFAQWQYRPSNKWTINTGLHSLVFLLNNTHSIEPRASIRYATSERSSWSVGYGRHGQMQPLGVYFTKIPGQNGTNTRPNRQLGFTQANHLVLSYDQSFKNNWHIKPEVYIQWIDKVPVTSNKNDAFSMLNEVGGFTSVILTNKGIGRNYGVELTVEKFLTKGFYCMVSTALFRSEYQGSNKVWHSTMFDAGYVNSVVAGKEWDWNKGRKNRTIGVNLKLTYMGGLRQTPIDLAASIENDWEILDESRAFEDKMPDYFRLDTGVRLKRNYKGLTTTLSLDLQNATNRKNVFLRYYDRQSHEVKYYYQAPLIPVLAYKLEF